jgi:hypothetical protein
LSATGGDTNIGFELVAKGTGEVTAKVNGATVFNASSSMGFKNRIINGAMVIDQRNAGASVTQTDTSLYYSVDRMSFGGSVGNKLSAQQSSVAPAGFVKSVLFTSLSAYTVGASEFFGTNQRIEGFNIADLGWGTANAATVTLSFQVRSSLTGTFGGALYSYSGDVSYPFSYTISSANTWTSISITIAGPTTGTFPTDNSGSLVVNFSLGAGSTVSGTAGSWSSTLYRSATGAVSVVGTNGATFYITGVQLEKGSTATSFDYRPYGTELQLAQRYYYRQTAGSLEVVAPSAFATGSATWRAQGVFPVPLRTKPTAVEQSATVGHFQLFTGNTQIDATALSFTSATVTTWQVDGGVSSGLTIGHGGFMRAASGQTVYLGWSAEL